MYLPHFGPGRDGSAFLCLNLGNSDTPCLRCKHSMASTAFNHSCIWPLGVMLIRACFTCLLLCVVDVHHRCQYGSKHHAYWMFTMHPMLMPTCAIPSPHLALRLFKGCMAMLGSEGTVWSVVALGVAEARRDFETTAPSCPQVAAMWTGML